MSDETQTTVPRPAAGKAVGEWFWRFLAVVMLGSIGWVIWIAYQINPPLLVTALAFEAAAQARASRNAQGTIAPAAEVPAAVPAAGASQSSKPESQPPKPEALAPVAPPAPQATPAGPAPEPREPPVNVEKLKLSDSIAPPISERPKKK